MPVPTDQCDLCASRTAAGKQPSCVHNCQADCMRYGTLEELAEYMGDNSHQALFFPDAEGKGKAAAEYIEFERKNADFNTEFSSE